MKVHILAVKFTTGNLVVESFLSRKAMVSRRAEIKKEHTCYMLPPVVIPRTAEGVIKIASLINIIHTLGPTKVMQIIEEEEDGEAV